MCKASLFNITKGNYMIKHLKFSEQKQSFFNLILTLICVIVLSFPIIKIVSLVFNISTISVLFNAANEVRDYVSFRLANFIIEGHNPYKTEFLGETNVPFMLLYTGLYPLIVAIFCKITGTTVLVGYYCVNLLLFVGSVFNLWLILKDSFDKYRVIAIVCLGVCSATFFSLFGLPIFNFHTDTIGIYISTLIFLIIYKHDRLTLLVAILTVSLIFTKQVMVVMALPIFLYYLIFDNKLAVKYGLQCTAVGIITYIIIQLLFPLYWSETIYAQFVVSKNYGDFYQAKENIKDFYRRYKYLVLIFVIGLISEIFWVRKSQPRISNILFVLKEVIIKEKFIVYLLLNIAIGTLSLCYFAKCGGDGYKYCQDLLAPSCCLISFMSFYKYLRQCNIFNKYKLFGTIALLVLCIVSGKTYNKFVNNQYTQEDILAYTKLDEKISVYSNQKLYLGMNSTQYMLSRNLWEPKNIWFNDGQIEYFSNGAYLEGRFIHNIFNGDKLKEAGTNYKKRVNEMVANKEFAAVTTCLDSIIDENILQNNYQKDSTYNIKTDTNGIFKLTLWLPK